MLLNERHSFISEGISREAFQEIAVRETTRDTELKWYLHAHPYDQFATITCNPRCQIVHKGIVATNVTQMDVASTRDGA